MKFSKSILLFTSLSLLVSCGRSRFPNNDNNDNNDNNNENNNNDNNNDDETTSNIDNEELIKKLQNGYVANVITEYLNIEGISKEGIVFFASGVCGIKGTNYIKGDNGDAYSKTLDLQNNIIYEPLNMPYDDSFINGYRLLENYKFENNELVIDDPKIQSTLFYSTALMPCGMYDEYLIMKEAVLQNYPEKNPKLCLEFQVKRGENNFRTYRVTAEYISFDYSDYLVEKFPTLPEQDRIGNILDKLRLLESYTIYYPAYDTYLYISQNILVIKNAYDSDNHQYFDYYYSCENDDIKCYGIKDNTIFEGYSLDGDSSLLRPTFAFAKEVLLEKSEDVYIFNPKITSIFALLVDIFLPIVFNSYSQISLDTLELHTADDDRLVVTNLDGVYAEYYNYNQTSIPQEYIDLVNSYNPIEN